MTASVTWLLPIKNGMPFLREALASIESQVYRDWKVLAWDNGSTDGSIEELHRWIPARLPGRVITSRPLGLGASLAEMTCSADTEFCARIDADDMNFPSRLERQVTFLKSHPEVAVVGSQVVRIDESGREHGQYHQLPLKHNDIVHRLLHSWVMWHPTVLFRRRAVIAAGNYRNFQPVLIEDYDLWLRLAAKYKMANLGECLVKYRVRKTSATMLALKAGTLAPAMLDCFVYNAPPLYGCSVAEAMALRNGARRFVFPLLLRIVRHLCCSQGGTVAERLRSESFHQAVVELVPARDALTHLLLVWCKPAPRAVLREMCKAIAGATEYYFKAALRRVGVKG